KTTMAFLSFSAARETTLPSAAFREKSTFLLSLSTSAGCPARRAGVRQAATRAAAHGAEKKNRRMEEPPEPWAGGTPGPALGENDTSRQGGGFHPGGWQVTYASASGRLGACRMSAPACPRFPPVNPTAA